MAGNRLYEDYHDFLEKEIHAYGDRLKPYVFDLPAFFRTLCGTLNEKKLAAAERRLVLAALGYLVAPNDLVPEAIYGAAGFADDVFVCATVLDRLVQKHGIEFAATYWEKEDYQLRPCLAQAIKETKLDLGDVAEKVAQFAGL
jgi:uncharacterized membrane protein YkvA (DUF1232 family)